MKLIHLFETIQEDRQMIAAANAIYAELRDIVADDPDGGYEMLGMVGEYAKVSEPLASVKLALYTSEEIGARIKRNFADDPKNAGDYRGFYIPQENLIAINRSLVTDPEIRTIITHELRHALDGFKSGGEADSSERYTTIRTPNPDIESHDYYGRPDEINARFTEVLHLMTGVMRKAVRENPATAREVSIRKLEVAMRTKNITQMFPERTNSSQYRQLIKRGLKFIDDFLARQSL